jgi:hypothetical protein
MVKETLMPESFFVQGFCINREERTSKGGTLRECIHEAEMELSNASLPIG